MAGNQFGEPHGHKRHADDELESNHNISTHFKKLRISITPFFELYMKLLTDFEIMLRDEYAPVDPSIDKHLRHLRPL
jgi:hypothetical protein